MEIKTSLAACCGWWAWRRRRRFKRGNFCSLSLAGLLAHLRCSRRTVLCTIWQTSASVVHTQLSWREKERRRKRGRDHDWNLENIITNFNDIEKRNEMKSRALFSSYFTLSAYSDTGCHGNRTVRSTLRLDLALLILFFFFFFFFSQSFCFNFKLVRLRKEINRKYKSAHYYNWLTDWLAGWLVKPTIALYENSQVVF